MLGPARMSGRQRAPAGPGLRWGLVLSSPPPSPMEAHRSSASIPPLPLPALQLGHGLPSPREKPFHLIQKRLAAGFTLPGPPVSPGGAGRVVAQQLPKGGGHREQLSGPTQLCPEDFFCQESTFGLCHSNCSFAELVFKPSLSQGAQPCQGNDMCTQYIHQPNLFSHVQAGN